jgi:D-ribose pyranase
MKKGGILNAELLRVIASLGHTDRLVIADSGLPIPPPVHRVDLALVAGIPSFLQTLEAVLGEFQVEAALVATEMRQRSPEVFEATRRLLGGVRLELVPHEAFKAMLPEVRAVVRTGEQTPYANVMLQSGVTF